jgi:LPXTG-site transpeptidase (sortase) family protein
VYIKNLKKGDIIELQDHLQQWYSFTVESFNILNVNTESISKKDDKEVLLLITCYPFSSLTSETPLRYIVSAVRNSVIYREEIS